MKMRIFSFCILFFSAACAPLPEAQLPAAGRQPSASPASSASGGPEIRGNSVKFSYKGPASKVVVAGSFNNWSQDANPMAKDSSGVWSAVLNIKPGTYQYKFVADGNWITDPSNKNTVTDADGNENSSLTVGGASAAPAPSPSASGGPQVKGNSVKFSYSGPASKVVVAGSFNNWSQDANPMAKDSSGVWSATVSLQPGTYQYKYVADGNWITDPSNKNTETDADGNENSSVTVGGASAAPAQGVASQAAAPHKADGGIMFSYSSPSASKVAVAGSFNNWSQDANPMAKDSSGVWSAVIDLSPGTYQYKFVSDGSWIPDPSNSNTAEDGFGGMNSVVNVQ